MTSLNLRFEPFASNGDPNIKPNTITMIFTHETLECVLDTLTKINWSRVDQEGKQGFTKQSRVFSTDPHWRKDVTEKSESADIASEQLTLRFSP